MSVWPRRNLGSLIKSASETFKFSEYPVVFLNTSDILAGKFLHSEESDPKTLPGQAKKRIKKGDLLFSEIRPANKRYAQVTFDADNYVVSTKLMVLRSKGEINTDFLRLFLTSDEILDYLQMIAEDRSGTFPQITFDILDRMEIFLPSIEEQKSIASVLNSFDDKVNLLHRQNKTLEAMAETLFRQWFVEEAGEDWETIKLGDIFDTVSGYNHKRDELAEEGDYLLSMGSVVKAYGINKDATRRVHTSAIDSKYICGVGDIVITTRDVTQDADLLGSPGIIPSYFKDQNIVVGSNLYKLQMINNKIDCAIVYQALKSSDYRDYVKEVASGTSVLMLKKSDLDEYSFKIPPKELLAEYSLHIKSINNKLDKNYGNTIFLEQLRDNLLPKLMSGEVRVA